MHGRVLGTTGGRPQLREQTDVDPAPETADDARSRVIGRSLKEGAEERPSDAQPSLERAIPVRGPERVGEDRGHERGEDDSFDDDREAQDV